MERLFLSSRIYVIAVVLLSIPAGAFGQRVGSSNTNSKASVPTPRTADGKPDLNGYWGHLLADDQILATKNDSIVGENARQALEGGNGSPESFSWWITHFETDGQVNRRSQKNRPIYKPEYWDKIRANDWDFSRKHDPSNQCLPSPPRLGFPEKIIQTPNEIVFLYETLNRFRIIPTDNRPHHPIKSQIPSWFGDSVGHWEGDTLVIETTALIEQSWIGPNGYIHSPDDLKVTERYRREGNTLHLQTTAEDPMLLQPWQMDPVAVQLNTNPNAAFSEQLCEDRDSDLLLDPNNLDPTRQGH
jgi:hypothetical protein